MMKPLYISFNGQVEKSPCVTVFNQSPSQLGETWRNTPAKHHNQPWSPLSVPLNTKKCHPALIKQPPLQRPRRIFGCSMAPTVTSCVSFFVLLRGFKEQLAAAAAPCSSYNSNIIGYAIRKTDWKRFAPEPSKTDVRDVHRIQLFAVQLWREVPTSCLSDP